MKIGYLINAALPLMVITGCVPQKKKSAKAQYSVDYH